MLKIKSILVSLLAIATLASCSDENDNSLGGGDEKGYDVAYMSISLSVPKGPQTRASGEEPAVGTESDINTLYVVTFGSDEKVVKDKDGDFATVLGSSAIGTVSGVTTPNTPVKVSTKTTYLLVIANPGAVLAKRLEELTDADTYTSIISLLKIPTKAETTNAYIVDEVVHSGGYTMINVGFFDDSDPSSANHAWKAKCLLDVSSNIILASDYKTDAAAQAAAKDNPAKLEIERLAAKLEVTVASSLKVAPFQNGDENQSLGQFTFEKWAIDHYNSHLFPYAEKDVTKSSHTASTPFYKSNFYTKDPNYDETGGVKGYLAGIVKNELNLTTLEPKVDWTDKSSSFGSNYKYCTENTMDADYQKFGAATRLVLRAQYVPGPTSDGFELGKDWFYLSNGADSKTFATLDALLAVYNPAKLKDDGDRTALEKRLVNACDLFYDQIKDKLISSPSNFAALTQDILDEITAYGGELTKVDGCLYWYQKSINYYYYEIRHDNEANDHMQFGKYGVVRNNYYMLNLTKVNGQGTPWYPGDGPEDPKEEEDIDKLGAFLHFEIEVAPWIKWETDFEI